MPILTCEACASKVRVPDGLGQIKVTCPNCEGIWYYPERREVSKLSVRCAKSGARGIVTFQRTSPKHRFSIADVSKIAKLSTSTTRFVEPEGDGIWRVEDHPQAEKHQKRHLFRTLVSELARRIGLAASPPDPIEAEAEQTSRPIKKEIGSERRSSDFDWTGFVCPYCGADGNGGATIIKCSGHEDSGKHYVCAAGVVNIQDRRFFKCFCGSMGELGAKRASGTGDDAAKPEADFVKQETFEVWERNRATTKLLEHKTKALPSAGPRRSLPPPKKHD